MNAILVLARKESGELLLSARGLIWLLAVSGALSAFALLLVSDTELSLLDNAQVVYDMIGIITALGALLALVVGTDALAGERERGSFMPLLLAPVSRGGILFGKLSGVTVAWAVMYALSLPYLWAVGSTGQNMVDGMIVLLVLGTPVVLAFGFFGLGLGCWASSTKNALLTGTVSLVLSASPLLLGPSLRQSAIGKIFDAINPFSAAINAFDAVIVDSQSMAMQAHHVLIACAWLLAAVGFAHFGFRRMYR